MSQHIIQVPPCTRLPSLHDDRMTMMLIDFKQSQFVFYKIQNRIKMKLSIRTPFALTVLITLFFSLTEARQKVKKDPVVLTDDLLFMCDKRNPISSARQKTELKWLVEATGKQSLLLSSSAQHQAACWILYKDRRQSKGRSRSLYLQRYALSVLHFASTKSNSTSWDWFMAVDEPGAEAAKGHWMSHKHHECNWYGVKCTAIRKKIKKLALGYLKLDGILPRELYLLDQLKELDMHANDFQGVLPYKIVDGLRNLEILELHMNGFFGNLHKEIAGLRKLRELRLFGNYFAGTLPGKELASLKDLEVIDMYANFLTGTIPAELGKLKKLRVLDLHDNNLVGSVPQAICNLKLESLIVDCLGPNPEVQCSCCTVCCRGLPNAKCVDVKTGAEV
ncbi:hypothetical protein FisN_1Hh366 [Fistulifera solaris]|uniref:Leucine-rich repeat-containing N-terminal plant-type domain-containing protein n=1 Tax=Fistulifera solaris TaxID=1519565 RepID=A0A1Z5J9Z9_FISSO|nr:hypothetical protein FisN_1Hh366 [Fistulifera solaris]|eukprot:GAX10824.1 hypothetical protein FisN_1Hh366 [Fistulifera solaris]